MKTYQLLLLVLLGTSITACVSKKKFSGLEGENQEIQQRLQQAESMVSGLKDQNAQLQARNANLQGEIEGIKGDMTAAEDDCADEEIKIEQMAMELSRLKGEISRAFSFSGRLGMDISVRDDKLYISIPNGVLFAAGSAAISREGDQVLDELSVVFMSNPDLHIIVEGHTDSDPVNQTRARWRDNWGLSVARAVGVVRALVEKGVSQNQLTASGRSDRMPAEDAYNKENHRRTEFIVQPKIDALYRLSNGG